MKTAVSKQRHSDEAHRPVYPSLLRNPFSSSFPLCFPRRSFLRSSTAFVFFLEEFPLPYQLYFIFRCRDTRRSIQVAAATTAAFYSAPFLRPVFTILVCLFVSLVETTFFLFGRGKNNKWKIICRE